MINDHTKSGEALKQLAQPKKVMLPQDVNPSHKEAMAKLSKLKGAEFGKEYVKEMVTDHEKDAQKIRALCRVRASKLSSICFGTLALIFCLLT